MGEKEKMKDKVDVLMATYNTNIEYLKKQIDKFVSEGINESDFNRTKKMIYGEYVKEYNDVTSISRMFLSDYFKGINSFDYLEEISTINMQYVNQVLKNVFR